MSGQVGPEAALCGEGATAQLTREWTLSKMCGLMQTQSSRAAEDTQADTTLVSSLGSRQRGGSCGSCSGRT